MLCPLDLALHRTCRYGNLLPVTELVGKVSEGSCTITHFFYLEVVAGGQGVEDPFRGPVADCVICLCEHHGAQVE